MKFKHLNYKDKILFIKQSDRFLLEGPFSLEFLLIRQAIYEFNREVIEI